MTTKLKFSVNNRLLTAASQHQQCTKTVPHACQASAHRQTQIGIIIIIIKLHRSAIACLACCYLQTLHEQALLVPLHAHLKHTLLSAITKCYDRSVQGCTQVYMLTKKAKRPGTN
jgi:hypothetical protein